MSRVCVVRSGRYGAKMSAQVEGGFLSEFYERFKGSLISGLLSYVFTLGTSVLYACPLLTAAAKGGL